MELQVVFVKWGSRYSADWVNRHVRAIKRNATCEVSFVCITDELVPDNFDQDVRLVPFPAFNASLDYLKQGCRLKMSMFKKGILKEGIPALFLDLDSSVLGDVRKIASHIAKYRGIHLLKSHWLSWWRIQKWVIPLGISEYYHGNGSAIGFYPEDYFWLFDRFNADVTGQPIESLPKTLRVDDRYTSCLCRDTLRVFPSRLISKFSQEFMSPSLRWESIRSRLPWVKKRRRNLVAVSFPGAGLKPDKLVELPIGSTVRYKIVKCEWQDGVIRNYWLPLSHPVEKRAA